MTYASPLIFSIHFPHAAYLEIEAEFTGIPSQITVPLFIIDCIPN